jgi:leucyl-tRNA synthetase
MIIVQANGTVRRKPDVSKSATKDEIIEQALAHHAVKMKADDLTIRKHIYLPSRVVNLVVSA